uniref:Uncharacterized protein n=1 Tax=Romanomermis culicivorax TaxID=13658 RepID=A0A915L958_ROMCU
MYERSTEEFQGENTADGADINVLSGKLEELQTLLFGTRAAVDQVRVDLRKLESPGFSSLLKISDIIAIDCLWMTSVAVVSRLFDFLLQSKQSRILIKKSGLANINIVNIHKNKMATPKANNLLESIVGMTT